MTAVAAGQVSTSSFLTFVLVGSLLFTFGYARAVWVRARRDYKTTKAAVKPLRKAMWQAIMRALKFGALVAVIGLLLFAWVIRDVRHGDDPVPAKEVVSPSGAPHPAQTAKPGKAKPHASTRAPR